MKGTKMNITLDLQLARPKEHRRSGQNSKTLQWLAAHLDTLCLEPKQVEVGDHFVRVILSADIYGTHEDIELPGEAMRIVLERLNARGFIVISYKLLEFQPDKMEVV